MFSTIISTMLCLVAAYAVAVFVELRRYARITNAAIVALNRRVTQTEEALEIATALRLDTSTKH